MKKLFTFLIPILSQLALMVSCLGEKDYITLDEEPIYVSDCEFEARYSPWGEGSSLRDAGHEEGEHVLCDIKGTTYELEFLLVGSKTDHGGRGRFRIIFKDGPHNTDHEPTTDNDVPYKVKLDTHSDLDTTFKAIYDQDILLISGSMCERFRMAVDQAHIVDSLEQKYSFQYPHEKHYAESYLYPTLKFENGRTYDLRHSDELGYYMNGKIRCEVCGYQTWTYVK